MNIYAHIPFCAQNCSYCTFQKVISCDQNAHRSYFEALKKEMLASSFFQEGDLIDTLYFGGGTPSLISSGILTDFFDFLKQKYRFSSQVEITLECHPATVSEEKIQAWKMCGINRISLGVQTFQTQFDHFLERNLSHTQKSLDLLLQSGLKVSADFIFGFPKQTLQDLQSDIQHIKSLGFQHISFYALDYKIGSKIEKDENKRLDFATLCSFYNCIIQELTHDGFEHYEIYNFAQSQQYSQHNFNFWRGEDYIGFGLSAVSNIGKTVRENTCNLKKYLHGDWLESQYDLDEDEVLEIFIKRRLRLVSGLKLEELKRFCQSNLLYEQILDNAKTVPSWLCLDNFRLALTQDGMMNFSEVIEILMND